MDIEDYFVSFITMLFMCLLPGGSLNLVGAIKLWWSELIHEA